MQSQTTSSWSSSLQLHKVFRWKIWTEKIWCKSWSNLGESSTERKSMSSGCALLKGKILQVPQKPLHLSKPTHWSFRRPQIVFQIKILSKQSNKWSRSTKSYNKKKSSRMPHSLSSRSLKTRKVSTKTRKVPPLAAIMGWLKSRATERKSTKDSNFSTWYWSHWFLFS